MKLITVVQQGFTLLELMIALALIGIGLTLGLPALQQTLLESRVNNAILSLNKDIITARSYAVSYETTVTLCHLNTSNECDNLWSNGYTGFIDENADQIFDSATDEKLFVRGAVSTGDILQFSDGNSLQYQFDGTISTTFAVSEIGTFRYCPGIDNAIYYSRAIIINQSGRPRPSSDIDNDSMDETSGDNDHIICN
ncbi:GspH/FimT family pseudopilin [Catenovulum maritimum]|uniref:Type II secretion system protein H n=1 Tax=Catenovulum maritimum TaxID=1513271 RepID=A0A0J8GU97_9ALTE|nr:GspH/FimT family pseudopilin [Catenovulum maritimum]KMT66317.1 hypothetical protein XM47_04835 [Catenovulum maritimum]